ncbi:DUF3619 family protein [Pulveribacter suum]|uniref:DUF3619 domain-containing protein n=1 Tax=Pulveribacter suum TaxID=2116657 RepID=A0A2P1NLB2_9BURK|nr:DUF3619 family protein [Pulveribacter suum]AVP57776.1 DUF3619 domain-containing protein [Pulveribacter suum]
MNRTPEPTADASLAMDAYARRIATRLTEASSELPYDITERLRAARMQALERRRRPAAAHATRPAVQDAVVHLGGGAAALGGGGGREGGTWWRALVSAVPLTALLAGLVFINISQDETLAAEMAEVDTALLADDLPPSAYADPGFVQYLRASGQNP